MSLLFFDTETTGKVDFRSPSTALHQPRLVQLAALLTDSNGKELASLSVIVQPDGFEVPQEVAAIHGISHTEACSYGVCCGDALRMFKGLSKSADKILAWNANFDCTVMEKEFHMHSMDHCFEGKDVIDPMKIATPLCKIPGPYGFKWPKLQEAHRYFLGRDIENAHNAMAGVLAMRDVWMEMINRQEAA